MGRLPKKPYMYDKINNLLSDSLKEDIQQMKKELEESRRQLMRDADELRLEADKIRKELRDKIAAKTTLRPNSPMPSPPKPPQDRSLHDSFYGHQDWKIQSGTTYYQQSIQDKLKKDFNYGTITMASAKKKKPAPKVVDKITYIDNIELFTPTTHVVRVSTRETSQDRENGTRQIVGMETVDWWEYVLIYGFLKATKIAYEYNIVKDMVKNPQHIVSLVNKGVLVLKFIPKKSNDVKEQLVKTNDIIGEEVLLKTGTMYREFTLSIEIPYKTGKRKKEVKNGYFLYEENYETIEVDYEELGRKIAQELNDKKVNGDFKQIIINEIENGRVSRVSRV